MTHAMALPPPYLDAAWPAFLRIANAPAALCPRRGAAEFRALFNSVLAPAPPRVGAPERGRSARDYDVVDGVAVIAVEGLLVQRLRGAPPDFGISGYDGVRLSVLTALNDRSVSGILLDVNSPGGEIAGAFDLADTIFRARGDKPIWAVANEEALGSAYAIASAADRVLVPRTGSVGSVGIVAMFLDVSRALAGAGVNVTVVKFGAHKADGSPLLPMSSWARAKFQSDVDVLGNIFVGTVARNRNLSRRAVVATEGATFLGASGVRASLADAVASPADALAELARALRKRTGARHRTG